MQEQLRQLVREKLSAGEIDLFIGYGEGTIPGRTKPLVIAEPQYADRLVFNENCNHNLVGYLSRYEDKRVGILVKSCDGRTLVTLIKEKQVERDNLWIVGVAASALRGGEGATHCRMCGMSEPPVSDVLLGEGTASADSPKEPAPSIFDDMTPDERFAAFQKYMETCINCHACRNACPLCYCETCFVDQSMPEWVSSGADVADKTMFHLGRLMHIAGRCGECGACAEACPMDIPLDEMARYVAEFVKENFDAEGGMSLEEPDALGAFSPNDDDSIFL